MSYLAIGDVTKAIVELLTRKMNKPPLFGNSFSFRITTLGPDDDRVNAENGINLFLYRVLESPFAKNKEWPGDRNHPNGSRRPSLALQLNYLMTAYAQRVANAAQDDITAHQLLGNAMSVLNDFPVLNDVHDADFDANLDTQFAPDLRASFEKIKIALLPTSMDEFSKIWTGFSKAYRLSVAYEVSLVQIAPLVPTPLAAPLAKRAVVQTQTIGAPVILSVTPSTGPAGAAVTITGQGFRSGGEATVVNFGNQLPVSDLTSFSATQIVLTAPVAFDLGPRQPITVTVGGRESAPAFYAVSPWIDSLQPLRGITGVPLAIPFEVPAGNTVSVEIGGIAAATTVDALNKIVRATVPGGIAANGPQPVVLILNGPPVVRSNALLYDVVPLITSFNAVLSAAPVKTTVTLTGERLAGKDIVVTYQGLANPTGANANATQAAATYDRGLALSGPVSVMVDGRQSNALLLVLKTIGPPQGAVGDEVTLTGAGLAGHAVRVTFGAVASAAAPQPFAGRFQATVPSGLVAGAVNVKVTIDGNDTNTVPFTVLL